MALRAGDVNAEAAWYGKAAASFPPNETWGFQSYRDDIVGEEFVTPVCRIHACLLYTSDSGFARLGALHGVAHWRRKDPADAAGFAQRH